MNYIYCNKCGDKVILEGLAICDKCMKAIQILNERKQKDWIKKRDKILK